MTTLALCGEIIICLFLCLFLIACLVTFAQRLWELLVKGDEA